MFCGIECRLFVLLFRTAASPPLTAAELTVWRGRSESCGADIFLWDEEGLRHLFPPLGHTIATSHSRAHTPKSFRNYFFFHASLLLWNATFGQSYPSIERFWRIEPDAIFAGPLSRMLELASPVTADVLLPHIEAQHQNPTWPHW